MPLTPDRDRSRDDAAGTPAPGRLARPRLLRRRRRARRAWWCRRGRRHLCGWVADRAGAGVGGRVAATADCVGGGAAGCMGASAGERFSGRRRPRDGDLLRIGETSIVLPRAVRTRARQHRLRARVADVARSVPGEAACPNRTGSAVQGRPRSPPPRPTSKSLTSCTSASRGVKTHLRGPYELFGVQHLAQNEKRATLVERASLAGVITEKDLADS